MIVEKVSMDELRDFERQVAGLFVVKVDADGVRMRVVGDDNWTHVYEIDFEKHALAYWSYEDDVAILSLMDEGEVHLFSTGFHFGRIYRGIDDLFFVKHDLDTTNSPESGWEAQVSPETSILMKKHLWDDK